MNRFVLLVLLGHSALAGLSAQSLSYSSGQNVSPAYEGWEQDADGKKYFVFGYMNRNWIEELDVPVGPDNSFNIGVGSSRVDLQACKLEYSIVSPK